MSSWFKGLCQKGNGKKKEKKQSATESEEENQAALLEQSTKKEEEKLKKEEEERHFAHLEQLKKEEEEKLKKEEEERQAAHLQQLRKEEEEIQAAHLEQLKKDEEEKLKKEEEERQASHLEQLKKEEEEKLKKEEEERQALLIEQSTKQKGEGKVNKKKEVDQPAQVDQPAEGTEEWWTQEVLKKKISDLPRGEVQTVLDENNGEAVFFLGREFNLNKKEMMRIRQYQMGGGQPEARFVDLLLTMDHTIEHILKKLKDIGNMEAYALLEELSDGKYEEFWELEPKESAKLYIHLEHKPDGLASQPSWKSLATALNMDNRIANIESAIIMGGNFSGGKGLLSILNAKNPTIGSVKQRLLNIEKKNEELSIRKVIDAFDGMVKLKVKNEMDEAERKRLMAEKRKAKKKARKGNKDEVDFADDRT